MAAQAESAGSAIRAATGSHSAVSPAPITNRLPNIKHILSVHETLLCRLYQYIWKRVYWRKNIEGHMPGKKLTYLK